MEVSRRVTVAAPRWWWRVGALGIRRRVVEQGELIHLPQISPQLTPEISESYSLPCPCKIFTSALTLD